MANAEDHDIHLKGRKAIEVTGVSNVESFDVNEFALVTSAGPLTIRGTNLHIKHLDLQEGVVAIEGTVHSLAYVSERQKKNRFAGRLFK